MTELEYSDFLKSETDLEREANLILEHHGIKGMKWGVSNGPPYPVSRTKSGNPTKAQKKKKASLLARFRSKVSKKTGKNKKAEKQESKAQIKKKLLTSTDAKYLYKYRDMLSDNELQDRINRLNKEQQLKNLIPKDKGNWEKIQNAEKFLKSTAAMAESVTKIYNSYNAVTTQQQRRLDAANARAEAAKKKKEEAEKEKQAKKS